MLTAGLAKVCITPPPGVPLAGFAARQGNASGVHDHLYARACVVEQDDRALAFVSVDLLALEARFVRDVRCAVQRRTGIAPEGLLIAATHTHAGPVTIRTFFNPGESLDAGYMETLAAAIEQCVTEAWHVRRPARIGVGTGRAEGVGVNRRTPDKRPIDDQVALIKVDDEQGHTRGVIINYACHPTVLGPDNLLVTGDFPHFTIDEVERALGPGSLALFINGTQGNISVGHSSELSAIGIITPGRTFERAAATGMALGRAALDALPHVTTASSATLNSASASADLPLKSYAGASQTAAALEAATRRLENLLNRDAPAQDVARARTERLYASITDFFAAEARKVADDHLQIELQGLRVGDTAFVAVPAEVFVEIGLRIKREATRPTFICGVTNGYIGYLPDRQAYAAGGYEVVASMCAEGADDALVRAMHAVVGRLFA
jgi:neutral/alkaline ceramidase-like enzyme